MTNYTRGAFLLIAIVCFFAVSSSAHATVEISDGSVKALYHLDTTSTDSSGNGYDGTDTSISYIASPLNGAASLNGTTSKIDLPSFSVGTTSFVVWLYSSSTGVPFLHLGNTSPRQDLWLDTDGSGNIRFAEYNGAYSEFKTSGTNYADSAWHLVIGTRSGSEVCLYVDDAAKGCGTLSPASTVGGNGNALGYDRINNTSFYGGRIDEAIWLSTVITTSTRSALWNGGTGSPVCVTAGCDGSSSGTPASASPFQRKLDGSTSIMEGSSTTETGVILGAMLTSSSSNNLKLQVQVSTSSSFTNVLTGTSSAVSSGASTTVTVYGLANATYYWRGRAFDADTNATSSWIQFEASGTADFVIDAPAAVEITNGSVLGLWHLDGNGADSSGNGYNGTSTAVSWVSGRLGTAGSFNSSTAKIDLPSFTTATATLIAWIKTSDPCCPYSHLGNNSPAQMLWLDTDGSGNVRFAEYNGAYSDLVTSGTNYADNAWHLVIGTRDGNAVCLYVDNIHKGCGTLSPSATLGGDRNSIGYDRFNNTSYYGGLIDEVGVLNAVITTSTRGSLWNGGAGREICVTVGCGTQTTPTSFYAQISDTMGILRLRSAPAASTSTTNILKELPAGWVVYVTSTVSSSQPVVEHGYRWYNVVDKTDGVTGWMAATSSDGDEYLPYVASSTVQVQFASTSAVLLTTKAARAQKIIESVDHYWANTSTTDELYSRGFTQLFDNTMGASSTFPKELFYGIAAQESGGVSFDNEEVSRDYGHGIMQLTARASSSDIRYLQIVLNSDPDTRVASSGPGSSGQETHGFGDLTEDGVRRLQVKYAAVALTPCGFATSTGNVNLCTRNKLNALLPISGIPANFHFEQLRVNGDEDANASSGLPRFDNRGIASKTNIPPCKELIDVASVDYMRNCYEDTSSSSLDQAYVPHETGYSSTTFKYYVNTEQSIYANVKDGLNHLQTKHKDLCATDPSATTTDSVTFECYHREWIRTTWRYNGSSTSYLDLVADKMDTFSDYSGLLATTTTSTSLAEKLRVANDHRAELLVYSPVTISITDGAGRSTGLSNGSIAEDIPNSAYNPEREAAVVFFPGDNLTYTLVGTDDDTYGIRLVYTDGEKETTIYHPAMPIERGDVHQYAIDWKSFKQNRSGFTLTKDRNGDATADEVVGSVSDFVVESTPIPTPASRIKTAAPPPPENTEAECGDGFDNDKDRQIDLMDINCRAFVPLPPPPPPWQPAPTPSSTVPALELTAPSSTESTSSSISASNTASASHRLLGHSGFVRSLAMVRKLPGAIVMP